MIQKNNTIVNYMDIEDDILEQLNMRGMVKINKKETDKETDKRNG